MIHAVIENGEVRFLTPDERVFNADEAWRRAHTLVNLSREEKRAFGAYEVMPLDPALVPEGQYATDWTYAVDGDVVRGTPVLAPIPPEPVPDEATVLQLYDEMDQTHAIDLEAAVGGRGPKALTRFRLANTIRRSDPLVADLQTNLGWTNAQVDALFIAASKRQ